MQFTTSRFGVIEFPEECVMQFPEGVLGFPLETRYILLEHDAEGSPFKWLQSLDNADLAFIVIDPLIVDARYAFEIDLDTERMIGTCAAENCAVMAIVNIPHGEPMRMTANLKAPLVVNVENRTGRQVVLGSNMFAISTPIFAALAGTTSNSEPLPQRQAV